MVVPQSPTSHRLVDMCMTLTFDFSWRLSNTGVLLENQGVGKNKIIDRLLHLLLQRPRKYIQIYRDSTVQQLMFQNYTREWRDSAHGAHGRRVLVVDEVDKEPEHVVAIIRSLATQGELMLSDG
ncbi:hypothetical protein EDB83DRAFT_2524496 [Lactarius deliciosus]|nr:hypothetical protein EDB83DRAFT_2524496 [Lactarius deliciosus]